jgi:4-hydroxyphenylacetate 3-hydroxylase C terminal
VVWPAHRARRAAVARARCDQRPGGRHHESLHGAGAPEAMRIQLRREIPLEPFEAAARSLLAQ